MRKSKFVSASLFSCLIAISGLSTAFLSLSKTALSESLYSWEDEKGVLHFSSKKATTSNAKEIPKHTVSRYSSDKVIGSNRVSIPIKDRAEKTIEEDLTLPIKIKKPSAQEQFEEATKSATQKETSPSVTEPILEAAGLPKVILNQDGHLKACSVEITNKGSFEAREVYVSFKFPSGSIFPARGQSVIKAGETSEYAVAARTLPAPIGKREDTHTGAPEDKTQLTPIPEVVIVHAENVGL